MLRIHRIWGVAPQMVSYSTTTRGGKILQDERDRIEMDKKNLVWRESPEKRGEWSSKFGLFAQENENADFITMLQQPWDTSIGGVKRWYVRKKERANRILQSYIPERHEMLGSNLATAHFIVFRGGRVKFVGDDEWVKREQSDDVDDYNLPRHYDPKYKLEAIDCSGMLLYYEGLENMRRLYHLKSLSFRDVVTFDDWCLDRLSGSENENLEELDLAGTGITAKSLCALYRLPQLKKLSLTLPGDEVAAAEMKLTTAMLEEVFPGLTVDYVAEKNPPETSE